MKKYLFLLLSTALISIGCYKDTDNTPPPEIIIETSEVFVTTSISGSVLDLNGNILSNYNLKVNDQFNSIPSDYFLLQFENLKKKGQTIHVLKNNKQIGIRTALLVENDINHIEIQQHPEYQQKTLSNSDPSLKLGKSLSVDFSATQWIEDYSGEVTIEYVNIESSNSLTPAGYSSVSDLLAVDSRGGFYLQVMNSAGENIQAQNEFPIIIEATDLSEDINSLFKFDKEDEVWLLVSEITPGDEITVLGEGYYTFANYTPGVFVEGVVKKEEKPVAYQPMEWDLASLSNQMCATEKGRWIALLPEKENIAVNLLNPCSESLQQETLEIDVVDLTDQNLIIENSDNYQLMDFTLLDCNGNIVSTPNVNINSGESAVHYVFSEEYPDRWIAVCDEFKISADNENGGTGPELSWSTDITGTLGILTDCSDLDLGYSFIKIRDDRKVFSAFVVEIQGERTILKSQDGKIKFIFKGMEKGMYDVQDVNVLINDEDFGEKGYYIKCENSTFGCGFDKFNVTHYASGENGTMRAEFSGTLWMQTLSPSVAGNFDVEGVIVINL